MGWYDPNRIPRKLKDNPLVKWYRADDDSGLVTPMIRFPSGEFQIFSTGEVHFFDSGEMDINYESTLTQAAAHAEYVAEACGYSVRKVWSPDGYKLELRDYGEQVCVSFADGKIADAARISRIKTSYQKPLPMMPDLTPAGGFFFATKTPNKWAQARLVLGDWSVYVVGYEPNPENRVADKFFISIWNGHYYDNRIEYRDVLEQWVSNDGLFHSLALDDTFQPCYIKDIQHVPLVK